MRQIVVHVEETLKWGFRQLEGERNYVEALSDPLETVFPKRTAWRCEK